MRNFLPCRKPFFCTGASANSLLRVSTSMTLLSIDRSAEVNPATSTMLPESMMILLLFSVSSSSGAFGVSVATTSTFPEGAITAESDLKCTVCPIISTLEAGCACSATAVLLSSISGITAVMLSSPRWTFATVPRPSPRSRARVVLVASSTFFLLITFGVVGAFSLASKRMLPLTRTLVLAEMMPS